MDLCRHLKMPAWATGQGTIVGGFPAVFAGDLNVQPKGTELPLDPPLDSRGPLITRAPDLVPGSRDGLEVTITNRIDDGAAVFYLNDNEVWRNNLPAARR